MAGEEEEPDALALAEAEASNQIRVKLLLKEEGGRAGLAACHNRCDARS